MTEPIKVCAWCDVDKSVTRKSISEGKVVSHGICHMHKQQQLKNYEKAKQQHSPKTPEAAY